MQNDPCEKEIKSAARAGDYLLQIDPKPGYGSRGLHEVPNELRAKFRALKKDEQYKHRCRR